MSGTMRDVARKMAAFRLTNGARALLARLSEHLGVSQAAVIEIAVRDLAKSKGVETGAADADTPTTEDDRR